MFAAGSQRANSGGAARLLSLSRFGRGPLMFKLASSSTILRVRVPVLSGRVHYQQDQLI